MSRWPQLWEYDSPPVVETVISAGIRPLAGLSTVRLVDFWRRHLQEDFPVDQEQPRHEPAVERFSESGAMQGGEFRIGVGALPSRFWFSSEDGEHLVQLQSDWLAFNWRKRPDSDYNRFPHGLEKFRQCWGLLARYAEDEDIGTLDARQCEVTYVNHVLPVEGVWATHADLHKVCVLANASRESGRLPKGEFGSLAASYRIPAPNGEHPIGRLHVSWEPSFTTEEPNRPLFVLTLTARGRPAGEGYAGVEGFFHIAHEWIVGSFDELTTDELHARWGRRLRGDQ